MSQNNLDSYSYALCHSGEKIFLEKTNDISEFVSNLKNDCYIPVISSHKYELSKIACIFKRLIMFGSYRQIYIRDEKNNKCTLLLFTNDDDVNNGIYRDVMLKELESIYNKRISYRVKCLLSSYQIWRDGTSFLSSPTICKSITNELIIENYIRLDIGIPMRKNSIALYSPSEEKIVAKKIKELDLENVFKDRKGLCSWAKDEIDNLIKYRNKKITLYNRLSPSYLNCKNAVANTPAKVTLPEFTRKYAEYTPIID